MSSSSDWWKNATAPTKLDKIEFSDYKDKNKKEMVYLQRTVKTFMQHRETDQRTIQTLTRKVNALSNEQKIDQTRIEALESENQTLTRKVNAVSKGRKIDQKGIAENKQAIDKLNKITKPLRRSKRKEEELLAQQDKLFESGKFDKCKMDRKIYDQRFKQEYPHKIAEWKKHVKFTNGGLKNLGFRRLSASSSFFKNHKATPRYIRLFIQRIYNTQK